MNALLPELWMPVVYNLERPQTMFSIPVNSPVFDYVIVGLYVLAICVFIFEIIACFYLSIELDNLFEPSIIITALVQISLLSVCCFFTSSLLTVLNRIIEI